MNELLLFHFLRPYYLLAILPLIMLSYWLWRSSLHKTGLEYCINPQLLSYLTLGKQQKTALYPFIGLALLWIISTLALAGPTWEKRPQALFQSESALIIALDLSPSMNAEDLKPSRIVRAHLKIQDLLNERKDGLTALIVYAGEAYVVVPLTDDNRTITNLLPTLKPGILPIPGSNVEMAIGVAKNLMLSSNLSKASLLLITDDINPAATGTIKKQLPSAIDLTILGVGSDAGAPIPNEGDFIKDKQGNIVIAKRNSDVLQQLAQAINGYYLPLQVDNSDIDFIVEHLQQGFLDETKADKHQRSSDIWFEFGPSLLVILLPFLALCFRRGWLLGLLFTNSIGITFLTPQIAEASVWESLWKNSDQQGLSQWQANNYDEAAKQFHDPRWQGSALYKKGDYQAALKAFEQDTSAIGDYNRGNTLAQLQQYDAAIAAYDQALKKQPGLEQAKINKERVEALKKQQEDQHQNNGQDQQSPNGENEKSNQESSGADQKNSNSSDQQQNHSQSDSQKENQNSKPNGKRQPTQNNQQQVQENDSKDKKQSASDQSTNGEENTAEKAEATQESSAIASKLSAEEQQALQQWLRKVPDDPSGLLRRKFEYEFQKRRQEYQQGDWQLPENDAHKRY
jgi:Ca-activated chloride channel family protein